MTEYDNLYEHPYDHPLFDKLDEAIDGAYRAAPNGEGVAGATYYAAVAAIFVFRGLSPSDAVAKAIGHYGTYGVERTYGLIPRPQRMLCLRGSGLAMWFESDEQREEAIRGVE